MGACVSRFAALAAGAFLVTASTGCATSHRSPFLARPPSGTSTVLLIDIPEENLFSSPQACGLNCLSKVLAYTGGAKLSAQDLERVIHVDPKRGAADFELASAARRLGYRAWFGRAETEDLERALCLGVPAIVLVQRDVERVFGNRFHWAVVHGLDFGRRRVVVDWATRGLSSRPSAREFIRMWRRGGQRAVLVWRRDRESPPIKEAE